MKDVLETIAIATHKTYGDCIIKEYDTRRDYCMIAVGGTINAYKKLKLSIVVKNGILKPKNEVAKKLMEVKQEDVDRFKKIVHLTSGRTMTITNEKNFELIMKYESVDRVDHKTK